MTLNLTRRHLFGLLAAPLIVRPGILMPVKAVKAPDERWKTVTTWEVDLNSDAIVWRCNGEIISRAGMYAFMETGHHPGEYVYDGALWHRIAGGGNGTV